MLKIDISKTKEFAEFTRLLRQAGSKISGAEFAAKSRQESGKQNINNRQILDWLFEGGRDVITMSNSDQKLIEKTFYNEVKRRSDRLSTRQPANFAKALDGILVGALRLALLKIIEIIRNRLKQQVDANGKGLKELSDEYRNYKLNKFGFAEPIGTATGQLLENIQAVDSNIKILRK